MALGDMLKFETFQLGQWGNKIKENPEQLLIGAGDPFSAKMWSAITGKEYTPFVNEWGGPTQEMYDKADEQGINTGMSRGSHKIAQAIASIYAGGAAGSALGGGGAAAGGAGGTTTGAAGVGTTGATTSATPGLLSNSAGLSYAAPGSSSMGSTIGANSSGLSYSGLSSSGVGGVTGSGGVGAGASSSGGLLSQQNMSTAKDVAGMAQQAGVFDEQQGPQAQSAGVRGGGAVDYSGLLSAARANSSAVTGAQRLAQQRMARRGR